jgi:transposase-like protein
MRKVSNYAQTCHLVWGLMMISPESALRSLIALMHEWISDMRSPPAVSEIAQKKYFEKGCALYLMRLRWPDVVVCIRCGTDRVCRFERHSTNGMVRLLFECTQCRYQFSVTTGTIFHKSHLPLTKWFLAIQRICGAEKGVAAKQLERELAVSYETAWKVTRRIRLAIQEDEAFLLKFSGIDKIWSAPGNNELSQLAA